MWGGGKIQTSCFGERSLVGVGMRLEGPVWGQGWKFGLVSAMVKMPGAMPIKELEQGLLIGLGPGGGGARGSVQSAISPIQD